jgi:hypothetical protein
LFPELGSSYDAENAENNAGGTGAPEAVNTVEIGHGLRNSGSFPEVPSFVKIVGEIGITQGGCPEDWEQPGALRYQLGFFPVIDKECT